MSPVEPTRIGGQTFAWGADAPPSWLTEVASRQAPEYDSDIRAVVLLDEDQLRPGPSFTSSPPS